LHQRGTENILGRMRGEVKPLRNSQGRRGEGFRWGRAVLVGKVLSNSKLRDGGWGENHQKSVGCFTGICKGSG